MELSLSCESLKVHRHKKCSSWPTSQYCQGPGLLSFCFTIFSTVVLSHVPRCYWRSSHYIWIPGNRKEEGPKNRISPQLPALQLLVWHPQNSTLDSYTQLWFGCEEKDRDKLVIYVEYICPIVSLVCMSNQQLCILLYMHFGYMVQWSMLSVHWVNFGDQKIHGLWSDELVFWKWVSKLVFYHPAVLAALKDWWFHIRWHVLKNTPKESVVCGPDNSD